MQTWFEDMRRLASELFSFRGRARIVDLIWLSLLLTAVRMAVLLPLDALPWDAKWYARAAVDIAFGVPLVALLVRRLHDQGLSGFWALLLVPFPPLNLYNSYRVVFAVQNPEWLFQPDPFAPWRMLLLPISVVVLILYLRPGTPGPNRYGPDPRQDVVAVTA